MGAVDYLLKPLAPEAVRAKVAVFAEQHRQSEQVRRQAELLREVERSEQERKLAELRLAGERRFRAVTDAMPQIVWTARADGGADYFNRRWFEYTGLGFTGDGPGFPVAIHPEEQEACADAWRVAVATGTPFQAECRLRRSDGALRWYLARAVPEYDQTGAIVGWLGTLTDIDDQKRAAAEAREAVRIRDEFLSVASHELRTPLTALALQVQSLLRALRCLPNVLPERAFERLRVIERQVTRMVRLVDELLDVSRLSAGQIRLSLEELDLPALVREVVEQISDRDARNHCPIEVHADGPIVGMWDRMRVEQVVTNLLTNALKFCDNKPIEVAVEQTDAAARLVVRDHGIGIKPEDRERIFGRFERAVSAREYGGLGLGLYITREIVKTHGGTISVESQPGDGARFVVELPLKPQAAV
jgi:PAS domain S-box-containing protein